MTREKVTSNLDVEDVCRRGMRVVRMKVREIQRERGRGRYRRNGDGDSRYEER